MGFFDRDRIIADSSFNRWIIPPAALAVHLAIGQIYAFSVFKTSLVAHFDRGLTPIAIIFSIAIVTLGISAASAGTWMERHGPRRAMFVSAIFFCSGLAVGAVGIATKNLWLLYFGYGVLSGIGLGVGYISPVSTLIKWFPDRPGMATGLAIMGFGGGALIAAPLSNFLLALFDPNINPRTPGSVAGGNSLAWTFATLAVLYLVPMLGGAWLVRIPPQQESSVVHRASHGWGGAQVSATEALWTPQFSLVWLVLFCNVTAGIGILEQAAPMIQDFFRFDGESEITAAEAGGFVGLLSLSNMTGRFIWSTISDVIGRRWTYRLYLGVGAVLYLLLATYGTRSAGVFVLLSLAILSFYGGGFATIPAYLKDLFGAYQVGAIHGRLLTAWSAAGIAGPLIVNGVLELEGTPGSLTAAAYRPALHIMAVLLIIGFIANQFIKPVDEEYFIEHEVTEEKIANSAGPTTVAPTGRY